MRRKDIERIRNKLREINSQILRELVLKKSRKFLVAPNKNGKKMKLLHHQCATCGKWYRPDKVEIDHIIEIGKWDFDEKNKGKEYGDITNIDWSYVGRMFCPLDNCQILCIKCHQRKTTKFSLSRRLRNFKDEDLL